MLLTSPRPVGVEGGFGARIGAEDDPIQRVACLPFRTLAVDRGDPQLDAVDLPVGGRQRFDLVGPGTDG